MRKLINFILILIMFGSVYGFYRFEKISDVQYKKHYNLADKYYKMGAMQDALSEYKKCQEMKKNEQVDEKIFDIHLKNEDQLSARNFIDRKWDRKELSSKTIERYLDFCYSKNDWKEYNSILNALHSEYKLKKYQDKIFNAFDVKNSSIESIFQVNEHSFTVKLDGKNVVIDSEGKIIFSDNEYTPIGYDEVGKIVTCLSKDKVEFLDINRTVRASTNDKKILPMLGGYYISRNKKHELKDKFGETQLTGDFISSMNEDRFATLNKNIVTIYDSKMKKICESSGNKIKTNINNHAILDNKIIVFNGSYIMYDLEKNISSNKYDDIDFSYGENIAVKKNGKWGFINQSFKEVGGFSYDEAKSFSWGIAFVKAGNKYRMINEKHSTLSSEKYTDVINFNSEGIGFVKAENRWKQIKLRRAIK